MPSLPSLLRRGPLALAARNASKPAAAALQAGLRVAGSSRSKPRRIVTTGRAAVVGGVAAGTAGLFLRRRGAEAPPSAPVPGSDFTQASPPGIANYDASGPPSNTATPVPAIDASAEPLGIDEESEVAAAAAEAANIGGPEIDYASAEPDMTAGDAEVAVFEGGGGEAEGLEQAEADLVDTVTADVGPGAGVTPAERRIDEAIEAAENPSVGETPDPAKPPSEGPGSDEGR